MTPIKGLSCCCWGWCWCCCSCNKSKNWCCWFCWFCWEYEEYKSCGYCWGTIGNWFCARFWFVSASPSKSNKFPCSFGSILTDGCGSRSISKRSTLFFCGLCLFWFGYIFWTDCGSSKSRILTYFFSTLVGDVIEGLPIWLSLLLYSFSFSISEAN